MCARALNLWVFRDRRGLCGGAQVKLALLNELRRAGSSDLITALLRAGELECAVADHGSLPVEPWSTLTDHLAQGLISGDSSFSSLALAPILECAPIPESVRFSVPEGFAYYALDPMAYANALADLLPLANSVAVLGIRSIGTTLSAMVTAAARARGINAERITVRPGGHPYNRALGFSPRETDFVRSHADRGSSFLVVDEGPGLSGSSFLSVAEALERTGVSRERILLLCSHQPQFQTLRAENGPDRARRFRWMAVSSDVGRPHSAMDFIGGGEWRKKLFASADQWPASWTSFERQKFISPSENGRRTLCKFIGLGHYGDAVLERETKIAEAGFGPLPSREDKGFTKYPWIDSRPMSAADLSSEVIKRLGEYCAFRAQTFPASDADPDPLQQMTQHNLEQMNVSVPMRLTLERPIIVDGRMQPHEWLLTPGGQILKTDSGSHGDDHFFPGPTDIAWDLAGAIVEWKMNPAQSRHFLDCYRAATGDDASFRVDDFVIAYAAFRWAYSRMAANALAGSEEQLRLEMAARNYEALFRASSHISLAAVQRST